MTFHFLADLNLVLSDILSKTLSQKVKRPIELT